MRLLFVSILLVVGFTGSIESRGALAIPERPTLYADFDNKVVGQAIADRGPTFGEPINLSNLDTLIVESTLGENHLRVSNDLSSSGARRLNWQMMCQRQRGQRQM